MSNCTTVVISVDLLHQVVCLICGSWW